MAIAGQVETSLGPVTGGLFFGDKAASASATSKFPISQDQRNILRARMRFQAAPRFWLATSAECNSGLPESLEGPIDLNSYLTQYGTDVLSQVNFAAGRVRPNFSLDVAAGAMFYHKETKEVSGEVEVDNLTNRLNLLNFASLFSGTAIALPRSFSVRMKLAF